MKLNKTVMVFPALAILSMGLLLSACGDPAGASTSSTSTGTNDAKSAFLADRGGTPGVNSSGTPLPGGGNRAPGEIGAVEKVTATR